MGLNSMLAAGGTTRSVVGPVIRGPSFQLAFFVRTLTIGIYSQGIIFGGLALAWHLFNVAKKENEGFDTPFTYQF